MVSPIVCQETTVEGFNLISLPSSLDQMVGTVIAYCIVDLSWTRKLNSGVLSFSLSFQVPP